jgi:all-trans-8'-apo-beta-carotenal 15,15'-oxygenase
MAHLTRRRGLAALISAPVLLSMAALTRAQPAAGQDPAIAAFDASAEREPWRQPLKGVDDQTGQRDCPALALTGAWPDALRGRFYRNGPALY